MCLVISEITQLGVSIGTILLAIIAFYQLQLYKKEREQKPKIVIEYEQKEPICRYSTTYTNIIKKERNATITSIEKVNGLWLRIKIKNIGARSAHKCTGKLVEIKTKNKKGNYELHENFDPVLLPWVGAYKIHDEIFMKKPDWTWDKKFEYTHPNKYEPINLGKNDFQYLDVAYVLDDGKGLAYIDYPKDPPRGIITEFNKGEYKFKIMIVGDNIESVECYFHVVWNGKWDEIIMRKILKGEYKINIYNKQDSVE